MSIEKAQKKLDQAIQQFLEETKWNEQGVLTVGLLEVAYSNITEDNKMSRLEDDD